MKLTYASALLALLIVSALPLRAQTEDYLVCDVQEGKKTSHFVKQCDEGTKCAEYDPIRSNESEARRNQGEVEVNYDHFGKVDCRTATRTRARSRRSIAS
jgi:hypothetical protein